VARFGNNGVIVGGLALEAIAFALFLPVGLDWPYIAMFPSFIALGVAFALAYGPLTIAATDGIAEEEQGLASGILTTSFQFGSALGLAVTTAVVVATTGAATSAQDRLDGFHAGLTVALAAAVLGVLATAPGLRGQVAATNRATSAASAGPASS
jgi:hypothetical protein